MIDRSTLFGIGLALALAGGLSLLGLSRSVIIGISVPILIVVGLYFTITGNKREENSNIDIKEERNE